MLRVGLIGAGRIGKAHARNITANPRCSLVAVSDGAGAAAAGLAGAYGADTRTTEDILPTPRSTPFSSPTPPAPMPT